jgi:hypothetical protein
MASYPTPYVKGIIKMSWALIINNDSNSKYFNYKPWDRLFASLYKVTIKNRPKQVPKLILSEFNYKLLKIHSDPTSFRSDGPFHGVKYVTGYVHECVAKKAK